MVDAVVGAGAATGLAVEDERVHEANAGMLQRKRNVRGARMVAWLKVRGTALSKIRA